MLLFFMLYLGICYFIGGWGWLDFGWFIGGKNREKTACFEVKVEILFRICVRFVSLSLSLQSESKTTVP